MTLKNIKYPKTKTSPNYRNALNNPPPPPLNERPPIR